MIKRLQNRVAESRWLLPVTLLYSVLVHVLGENTLNPDVLIFKIMPFAVVVVTTYVIAETNTRLALLRVRSRMVSCTYLFLATMIDFENLPSTFVMLAMVFSVLFMLNAYQDSHDVNSMFTSGMAIGIASMLWIHVSMLIPVMLILAITPVYALSYRTFIAYLMGCVTPYWVSFAILLLMGNYDVMIKHVTSVTEMPEFMAYNHVTLFQTITIAMLTVLLIIGTVHIINKSYLDKLRVRMAFRVYTILAWLLLILTVLFPSCFAYLIPLEVAMIAAPVAHYFTFTSTKLTNLSFVVTVIMVIFITLTKIFLPGWMNSFLY